MTEVIQPLTPDESTVLEIACSGAHMAAIGRWEHPTKSLESKGLLQKLDDVNYVVTDAGRARAQQVERDYDQALGQIIVAAKTAALENKIAQGEVDGIARQIVELAARWAKLTGKAPYTAQRDVVEAVSDRAEDIYRGLA